MASQQTPNPSMAEGGEIRRRDFIHILSGAGVAAGAAMVAWPLVQQMNPAADTRALSTVEVDLTPVAVGQTIKLIWQGKPTFVRHRTAQDIALARKDDTAALRDKQTDAERVTAG
jgi:ubiquinol-cytochrome c reductase iron-sulfur subunit